MKKLCACGSNVCYGQPQFASTKLNLVPRVFRLPTPEGNERPWEWGWTKSEDNLKHLPKCLL